MKMRLAAVVIAFAVGDVATASDRPSGLDVWMTCRNDVKVVCPNAGLSNIGSLKRCMKINFSQLGPRCQSAVVRYQNGRPELASRNDLPR